MNWSRKMPKSVCVLLFRNSPIVLFGSERNPNHRNRAELERWNDLYQQSIAGMMNTKTIDTLQIQSDSTFTLTLPVEDYERVNFILYGKAVLGSVISKGGKYNWM